MGENNNACSMQNFLGKKLRADAMKLFLTLPIGNTFQMSSYYYKHMNDKSENTHLLRKGKYLFTTDLLFDWLGFNFFVYV